MTPPAPPSRPNTLLRRLKAYLNDFYVSCGFLTFLSFTYIKRPIIHSLASFTLHNTFPLFAPYGLRPADLQAGTNTINVVILCSQAFM